jgi:hypothetical protein
MGRDWQVWHTVFRVVDNNTHKGLKVDDGKILYEFSLKLGIYLSVIVRKCTKSEKACRQILQSLIVPTRLKKISRKTFV